MQAKVSVVMPCYNKVADIGFMLASIREQAWDNLQLILVNDGSTDGTREVIAQWEPMLRERGYEVVVVDQENQGCIAAVKAGFSRVSGDYVCVVDADDELHPEYVSATAGWLEEHRDYDYTACDYAPYTGSGEAKELYSLDPLGFPEDSPVKPELYLAESLPMTVWSYMIRQSYFDRCRIAETLYTASRGSYEPGILLPLFAFGGRGKHIPRPLYRFNTGNEGMSRSTQLEKIIAYYDDYQALTAQALAAIPDRVLPPTRKEHLNNLCRMLRYSNCLGYAAQHRTQKERDALLREALDFYNSWMRLSPPLTETEVSGREQYLLWGVRLRAIERVPRLASPHGRVVGWGAKGTIASLRLPLLRGTSLAPAVLWDEGAAAGDTVAGLPVTVPDPDSLTDADTVLVFPKHPDAVAAIARRLEGRPVGQVIHYRQLLDALPFLLFPQLGNPFTGESPC